MLGLQTLSTELARLKQLGHTAVALDALIPYVDALTRSASAADPESERQRIRLNFEGLVEQYRADVEGRRELLKAVLEAAQSALRTLSLVNGAAAVAILAFLGNVLAHPTTDGLATVPPMSKSMVSFAVGVGLAAVGFAARYFSQAYFSRDFTADAVMGGKWGRRWRCVAIAGAVASLIAFFVGIGFAFRAVT